MTIQQFFDAYNGLWIESTGISDIGSRDQCVDLWRVYNLRVIGGPNVSGNAVDYWNTFPTDFYDKIPNSPTAVPKLGDVMIWGTNYGPYGHIAVCTDIADTKGFTSFDQNDPLKSPCHYQPHTYTGVLGWLRPKNLPVDIPVDPMKIKVSLGEPYGTLEVQAIRSKLSDLERDVKNARDVISGFVVKWSEEWKLSTATSLVDIEVEMSKLLTLEERVHEYRDSIEDCVGIFPSDKPLLEAHAAVRKQIDIQTEEINKLKVKLEEAKVPVGYEFLKSWTMFSLMWKLYRKKVN